VVVVAGRTGIPGQESSGTRRISGIASWYCGSICTRSYPGGLYAAAGPALRVGDWRGRVVNVSANGRSVLVKLIDWCACPQRALDLYRDAFFRLTDPSRGLVKVTVSW
jgi:rare lipoprotein A (peptidoglycan hydrolase)